MQDAIHDIEQHRGASAGAAPPTAVGDLLRRRDAASRRALEARYLAAAAAARIALLQAAPAADNEQLDLLRLGLRDDDDDATFAAAVTALCAQPTPSCSIDLQDALARCRQPQVAPLLAALTQLARKDPPTARWLALRAAAEQGLERAATGPFARLPADAAVPAAPTDRDAIDAALDAAESAVRKAPTDAAALVTLAQANLDLAWFLLPSGDGSVALWFEDARRTAERALATATAAERPAAEAIQAIALRQQGNNDDARHHAARALAAVAAAGPTFDPRPRWVAELLGAAGRSAAASAYAADPTGPDATAAGAVADAAFAFATLATHPWATDADACAAAVLLAWAGARTAAQQLLGQAVARWPAARELHEEYRRRLLTDRGAEGLRRSYAAFVTTVADHGGDRPAAEWFAGYAALVAAEVHVGDRRDALALAAYTDCIEHLRASAAGNADYADSAQHFAVLALAGRALQRHLAGDGSGAVLDLLAAGALRPASMGERDGLQRTPTALLGRIARELTAKGQIELAARLPQR